MMLRLSIATLRHRAGSFVGAFVAVFCAAALVCGCLSLLATGLFGDVQPERYANAPIVIAGDQYVHMVKHKGNGKTKIKSKAMTDHVWVSASLAQRIQAQPSVRRVVTEVTFPVFLPGGRTSNSWGHGWESAPMAGLTLAAGHAPSNPGEVVVDATTASSTHLPLGSTIVARTAGGALTVRVVGVAKQGFSSQTGIFFTSEQARQLAGHPGMVSAIGVWSSDAGLLSAVVAPAVVYAGDRRGAAEFPDAETARVSLISMGGALAGTSIIVALLVVVGTFGLTIQQRQREIAVLRAVAATTSQVRRMIDGEALLIGSVAGAGGAVAGLSLGAWLHHEFVGLHVIPPNLTSFQSPLTPVAAAVLALLAGWAAARISARRATAIRPVEALGEAELTPGRIRPLRVALALAATAGAIVMTALLTVLHSDAAATPVCFLATLLWSTAVALAGPVLARGLVAILGVPMRLSRVAGYLAAHNLRTRAHRLASIVVPLTLLTAMAWTILFSHTTVAHAAASQRDAGIVADYIVGSHVTSDDAAAIEAVPGVRTATRILRTQVRVGLTRRTVQGVTPERLTDTLDLGITSGSPDRLNDSTALAADGLGYHLNDRVHLTLADGTPANVTIVGLYRRELGFGDLTLAHDVVAAHVDVPLDDEILVRGSGVTAAALAAAVHGDPGIGVQEHATAHETPSDSVGYVILGLIIAFTAIAVVNTLAMSITERVSEFDALRLAGATRRQVMRMVGWETSAAVVIGSVLGVGITIAILTGYASGITRGTASPWASPPAVVVVTAGVALLAAFGSWVPAHAALARLRR